MISIKKTNPLHFFGKKKKGKKQKFSNNLTMNWYKFIKKADQALPGAQYIDEIPNFEYYIGPEEVDRYMSEKTKEKEEQLFPHIKPLGQGHTGMAYIYGNIVIKYVTDNNEYECAKHLLELQKQKGGKIPGFIEVYSAEMIEEPKSPNDLPIYRLVIEKVVPLQRYNEKMFHIINAIFFSNNPNMNYYGDDVCSSYMGERSPADKNMISNITESTQKLGYEEPYTLRHISPKNITHHDVYYAIVHFCELVNNILAVEGSSSDAFGHNIGVNEHEEWVLLDIGGSFFI